MTRKFAGLFLGVLMVVAIQTPIANAQVTDIASLRALIQSLLDRIAELQVQKTEINQEIGDAKVEIKTYIRDGLKEGMSNDDIKEVQELLSSDRSIYPEGITSGYFGPLTKAAIRRFQTKYKLEVTGEIDDETKAAFDTLLEERFGEGKVPSGLLTAPGIKAKFERRLELGCDNSGKGKSLFCVKIRDKYKFADEDDDSDEDSDDDDSDEDSDDDNDDDDDGDGDDDSDSANPSTS